MRKYNQPETNVLQVINSSIVCVSPGPVYSPTGSLGTMSNGSVQLGTMSTAESHSF